LTADKTLQERLADAARREDEYREQMADIDCKHCGHRWAAHFVAVDGIGNLVRLCPNCTFEAKNS
jgi:hypothetical protein